MSSGNENKKYEGSNGSRGGSNGSKDELVQKET